MCVLHLSGALTISCRHHVYVYRLTESICGFARCEVTLVMNFYVFWKVTSYRLESSCQPLWRGRRLKTCMCMFRIHHLTGFDMSSCNCSLVISMNLKWERNISPAMLFLSCILHHYLSKSCEIFRLSCIIRHFMSKICGSYLGAASQFRASAMLLLVVWDYKAWCHMILRWSNIFTNFRGNWATCSEVVKGEKMLVSG